MLPVAHYTSFQGRWREEGGKTVVRKRWRIEGGTRNRRKPSEEMGKGDLDEQGRVEE